MADEELLFKNDQLLQDNIEMHGLIEMLRTEIENNTTNLTTENQSLQKQQNCLKLQLNELESENEKRCLSLKSQLASALKTANLKSDEAAKLQSKYD